MIYFEEEGHQYRLDNKETGKILISATTLIGLYKPKFDEYFWSHYTALRVLLDMEKKEFARYLIVNHGFQFGSEACKTVENIRRISYNLAIHWDLICNSQIKVLKEWKQINLSATQRGNVVHAYEEGRHFEDDFYFEDKKVDVCESNANLYTKIKRLVKNKTLIIPELRIANREFGIAGSIDQPIFFTDNSFSINDYKTNKKIETDSKYPMLDPIAHISDCNYYHYALQLSLYAWMIKQETGFKLRDLYFTHFKFNEKDEIIGERIFPVPYLEDEIQMILKDYAGTKSNT